jgi:DUF438 domain-containing protein
MAEEELINEGLPREEIHRLCEVHLAVFRETLEQEIPLAPKGHPIHTLMEEHNIFLEFASELKGVVQKIKDANEIDSKSIQELKLCVDKFKGSESHYIREENVLFPYLEKHGVTQPPAIMWMEHDQIREVKKALYKIVDEHESMDLKDFTQQLEKSALSLAELLMNHFPKESSILFPTALRLLTEDEWSDVVQQFDELGYGSSADLSNCVIHRKVSTSSIKLLKISEPAAAMLPNSGSISEERLSTSATSPSKIKTGSTWAPWK